MINNSSYPCRCHMTLPVLMFLVRNGVTNNSRRLQCAPWLFSSFVLPKLTGRNHPSLHAEKPRRHPTLCCQRKYKSMQETIFPAARTDCWRWNTEVLLKRRGTEEQQRDEWMREGDGDWWPSPPQSRKWINDLAVTSTESNQAPLVLWRRSHLNPFNVPAEKKWPFRDKNNV